MRMNEADRKHLHPLRGGFATLGGFVGGLGVGLALLNPAAGLLAGGGAGMVITAVLRAHGRWR